MSYPVVKGVSYFLAHVPDLVRYGSKPNREIKKDEKLLTAVQSRLRTYEEARDYAPHQAFIGNMQPESLWNLEKPWFKNLLSDSSRFGPWGEIMPQDEFYAAVKIVDEFDLFLLTAEFINRMKDKLEVHPLFTADDVRRMGTGTPVADVKNRISAGALPVFNGNELVGCMVDGHDEDTNLTADILLENLVCKASGVLAIRHALHAFSVNNHSVDYIINSGEEGVGDRYQRGAGNLAKAMAEHAGCSNATGADMKAFCCGPIHAMIVAGSLTYSEIHNKVLVVGGGCLAKLGMKLNGHLKNDMPIMEDVLGAFAVVVTRDDLESPQLRLDIVGKHNVSAGSSQQAIYESLVKQPLQKHGKKIPEIAKYATELHNPEITEPAGSGNVPRNNYRMIAGLAVMQGQLQRSELDGFEKSHGMPGFSPTQGHVPSAIPYLGHACKAIINNEIDNAMFIGKGSLFLGKMTNLSDGMSFIIEKNKSKSEVKSS